MVHWRKRFGQEGVELLLKENTPGGRSDRGAKEKRFKASECGYDSAGKSHSFFQQIQSFIMR